MAAARPAWLGYSLTDQLPTQVEFCRAASVGDTSVAGVQDWLDQAVLADFPLPELSSSALVLLSAVGFHWFHFWLYVDATNPGYQSEADMYEGTLYPFLTLVVDPCALAGYHLQWGVGNFGFPSGAAEEDAQVGEHDPAYTENSQELEAGHLVRGFLTLVGYGANHVLWFSHMGEKEGPATGEFATMGLRNDDPINLIDSDGDGILDPLPPASTDAWPKAAWYAFQRLALFMSRCSTVDYVYNVGGLVVLRLVAGPNGFAQPDGSGDRTWRYAYVFWIDGASPTTTRVSASVVLSFGGLLAAREPFERVALVPAATDFQELPPTGSPYAVSSDPDWGDADPNANPEFGHANQPFAIVPTLPPDWIPDGMRVRPLYLEVSLTLTPTNQENFGIVAWMTDTANITVT